MIRDRIFYVAVTLAALLTVPGAASAQFDGNFAEWTLQSGAFQPIAEEGTATSYSVLTGVAFRTTPQLRIGGEFGFNGIGVGDDVASSLNALGMSASTSMLEYGVFARYHLDPGVGGYYVKGSVGFRQLRAEMTGLGASMDASENVLGYGLAVGYVLKGYTDVGTFFEAEYGHAFPADFEGSSPGVDNVGFDSFKLSVGVLFGLGR